MNQLHLGQRCLLPIFTLHCVVWKNQVHQPFPLDQIKSTVQPRTLFSHVVTHRKVASFTSMQRNKTRISVCVFNAKSVGPRDKCTEIVEFICDECIAIMFLTETWMRSHGDEAKYADLTPPGYSLRSYPPCYTWRWAGCHTKTQLPCHHNNLISLCSLVI